MAASNLIFGSSGKDVPTAALVPGVVAAGAAIVQGFGRVMASAGAAHQGHRTEQVEGWREGCGCKHALPFRHG